MAMVPNPNTPAGRDRVLASVKKLQPVLFSPLLADLPGMEDRQLDRALQHLRAQGRAVFTPGHGWSAT